MKRRTPHRTNAATPRSPHTLRRKTAGFAAGLGVGLLLWAIISLSQQSVSLGLVFGLLPGIAIGCGLALTAGRDV